MNTQPPNHRDILTFVGGCFPICPFSLLRTGMTTRHRDIGARFVKENQILQLDLSDGLPILHSQLLDTVGVALTGMERFFFD